MPIGAQMACESQLCFHSSLHNLVQLRIESTYSKPLSELPKR